MASNFFSFIFKGIVELWKENVKEDNETKRTEVVEAENTKRTEVVEAENTKRTEVVEAENTKRTNNENMHNTIQTGMDKITDIKKENIQKNKEIESKKIDYELAKYQSDKDEKVLIIEKQAELEALKKNLQTSIQKQLMEHETHKEFLKIMQMLIANNIKNNNDTLIKEIEEFQNKKDSILKNQSTKIDEIKDNIYQIKNKLSLFEREEKELEKKLNELIGKYELRNQDYLEKKKEIRLLKNKKLTQDVKNEKKNLLNLEQEIEDIEYEILVKRLEQKKLEKTIIGINKILKNLKAVEEKEKFEYKKIELILSNKQNDIINSHKQNAFQLLENYEQKVQLISNIQQIKENYFLPFENHKELKNNI